MAATAVIRSGVVKQRHSTWQQQEDRTDALQRDVAASGDEAGGHADVALPSVRRCGLVDAVR